MKTLPSQKVYRDRRVPRTYQLLPSTARAISELTEVWQVYDSDLIEALLSYALAAVASGALEIEFEPVLRRIVRS